MGLALAARDVAALEGRTEGWIAGLQLAALSMQGRDDVAGSSPASPATTATSSTTWSRRSCSASPNASGSFLLQTSILDRLSGPLCDAVTGQDGGKAMLEALERGNLFVVPLDDRRQWYRYHHLFADVLRAHLLDEQPDQVAGPAPARERVVRAARRAVRGDPPRAGRRGFRSERRTWSSWRCPALRQEPAGGHAAGLARGAPRRAAPPQARAQHRLCRGVAGSAASSRASRPACGTPNGGWTDRRHKRADADARRRRWSSWTKRSSAVSRVAIAVYRAGTGPGAGRCGRRP